MYDLVCVVQGLWGTIQQSGAPKEKSRAVGDAWYEGMWFEGKCMSTPTTRSVSKQYLKILTFLFSIPTYSLLANDPSRR